MANPNTHMLLLAIFGIEVFSLNSIFCFPLSFPVIIKTITLCHDGLTLCFFFYSKASQVTLVSLEVHPYPKQPLLGSWLVLPHLSTLLLILPLPLFVISSSLLSASSFTFYYCCCRCLNDGDNESSI